MISQREEEEALQREAEERLAIEQAARAEEDARLRELYPLPEDDEDYSEDDEYYEETKAASQEQLNESIEQAEDTTETEPKEDPPIPEELSDVDSNANSNPTIEEEGTR